MFICSYFRHEHCSPKSNQAHSTSWLYLFINQASKRRLHIVRASSSFSGYNVFSASVWYRFECSFFKFSYYAWTWVILFFQWDQCPLLIPPYLRSCCMTHLDVRRLCLWLINLWSFWFTRIPYICIIFNRDYFGRS